MKLDQSEASILHEGGLLFTKGATQVALSQPGVEIKTPPVLTVKLGATPPRPLPTSTSWA